jgi:hypothetical protein
MCVFWVPQQKVTPAAPFENSCLNRITAGVAMGSAVGGAIGEKAPQYK